MGPLRSVAADGAAQVIVTGGEDGEACVWDPRGFDPVPRMRKCRVASAGQGMRSTFDEKTRLLWQNGKFRTRVLAVAIGAVTGAVLLLSGRPWYAAGGLAVLGWSVIPTYSWHAETLRWNIGLDDLAAIRPLRVWPLVPFCPFFSVVHCPCCGRRIAGRRGLLHCRHCGFEG